MELNQAVPLHTPLDARTYLGAYHPESKALKNKAMADKLQEYALVEPSALAECWPDSDWKMTTVIDSPEFGFGCTGSNKAPVPSLRTLSQNKLFQELLSSDSPPDLTLLDQPMLFSGFARDLQLYLIENVDALSKSPAAVEFLKKAFWGEKFFDFTPFQGKLSAGDLIALASSEALRNVKVANLSGFDTTNATDAATVATILDHLKLDSLHLLARPDRTTDDQSEILKAFAKCHNEPLVRQRLVLGTALSQVTRMNVLKPPKPTSLDPSYWKTFPVTQLLYKGPDAFNPRLLLMSRADWLTDFFLGDSFLTPVRFVTGLLTVIKYSFQYPASAGFMIGHGHVPVHFACVSSSLRDFTAATEVGTIPAQAYARSRRMGRQLHPMQDIHPVGWTAVVVHTATGVPDNVTGSPMCYEQVPAEARFRVALVRSKSQSVPIKDTDFGAKSRELEVVDLKGFLDLTAPEHAGDLVACLSDLTAWAKTNEELVSELTADEVVTILQAFADRCIPDPWLCT